MPNCANIAATLMEHLVTHDWHGYTQGNGRWGDGEGFCYVDVDGDQYKVEQGDRDCSSAVIDCWQQAISKTPYAGALGSATYTGDMRSVFVNSGLFVWHPMSDGYIAQRGDIYLNEVNHTAMCTSAIPDMLAEFSINEFGGITGGVTGDQTGNESRIAPYYSFPWDGILAYNGKADEMAITDEDAKKIADQVWRYILNSEDGDADAGNYMREIRRNTRELTRTDDPTGRGVLMNDHDHIKWIAAKENYIVDCLTAIADKLDVQLPKFE